MNATTRLEFEFAYYDSAVHRINHYTTRRPPTWEKRFIVVKCLTYWTVTSLEVSSNSNRAITYSYGLILCSTMWVGCQSRRFNCLFWRETRQRILGHEISPYPEVVRGGEWELTTRPRERQGPERGKDQREAVGNWTGGEAVGNWTGAEAVGSWTGAEAVGVDPRRGSQHQTPSREARRQDRVQWRRVSRCLIPVALWNFR